VKAQPLEALQFPEVSQTCVRNFCVEEVERLERPQVLQVSEVGVRGLGRELQARNPLGPDLACHRLHVNRGHGLHKPGPAGGYCQRLIGRRGAHEFRVLAFLDYDPDLEA